MQITVPVQIAPFKRTYYAKETQHYHIRIELDLADVKAPAAFFYEATISNQAAKIAPLELDVPCKLEIEPHLRLIADVNFHSKLHPDHVKRLVINVLAIRIFQNLYANIGLCAARFLRILVPLASRFDLNIPSIADLDQLQSIAIGDALRGVANGILRGVTADAERWKKCTESLVQKPCSEANNEPKSE